MGETVLLLVDGEVERPLRLAFADLCALPDQIDDVGHLVPGRQGVAVSLATVIERAGVRSTARYLTLHATRDDFHASIPLAAVQASGLLVYCLAGEPLPTKSGGPVRFLIPEQAACQTAEIDECANVKFVDRLELTSARGRDNRPTNEAEHARLHEHQK